MGRKPAPKKSMPPEPVKIWEQQPDEGAQAFQAFARYRDLGADRSTRKVADLEKKSLRLIQDWSATHRWVDRVKHWDIHLDRLGRRERRKALVAMTARHATIAAAMQNAVVTRLKKLDPNDLKVGDCVRLFQVSVKIERESRALPSRDMTPEPDYDVQDELANKDADVIPLGRNESLYEAMHVMDEIGVPPVDLEDVGDVEGDADVN